MTDYRAINKENMKDKMKKIVKRIWMERNPILNSTCHCVGILYTMWGFLSVWFSLEGSLPTEWTFWNKLALALTVLLVLFVACFMGCSYWVLRKISNTICTSNSNHKVIVQYGDMYSPDVIAPGYTERRNIVVNVNRCFDTIVNNNLVSERTQHGRVMKKLYTQGLYTPNSLNDTIQQNLNQQHAQYEDLTVANKSQGNTYRYECGTVAEIPGEGNVFYFLLGMSKFDSHFKASTSKEEFCLAIQRLIEFCNSRSQGYPVILPLLGSDMARTNISQTEILSYIVNAFKVNKDKISCDFHIVIWEGDKDKISIQYL